MGSPFFEGLKVKDWPEAFWGLLFVTVACLTAVTAARWHSPETASIITLATSIVTGTFGYLKGRSDGAKTVQVPTDPPTTATVTIRPTTPADPAPTK